MVTITDLKGLVLGQEFSIKWDLLVNDLEKFNCYPEDPTASEESCKQRGCLWEVSIKSKLPNVDQSYHVDQELVEIAPQVIRHLENTLKCLWPEGYHDSVPICMCQLFRTHIFLSYPQSEETHGYFDWFASHIIQNPILHDGVQGVCIVHQVF